MKMKAHPKAMSRICHQASFMLDGTGSVSSVGSEMPVMDGTAEDDVPEGVGGTITNWLRQTPRPSMTLHPASEHDPSFNTWLELEHARQLPDPEPEQLEQLESQD